jgi:hypothetical protein
VRTIIAGSRSCYDYDALCHAMTTCGWLPTVVLSGAARGVDTLGERWARQAGVALERYPAAWSRYGKPAGHIRNEEMAERADGLVALWDGASRGTRHMIETAYRRGLHCHVLIKVSNGWQAKGVAA